MKKMNKLTVAALALTAIGFASTAASAQTVSTATFGDLILGFQVATGMGSNTNLEVDLGSFTSFQNATSVINLSSKLSVGDLTSTYGSSWATLVNWSVAGVTANDGSNTFDATSTAPITTKSTGALSAPEGLIFSLSGGLNGAPQAGTTTSALIGNATTPASSISGSYTSLEGGNGYGFVPNAEQTGAGTDELYSFVGNNGTSVTKNGKTTTTFPAATDLGTFSLSSTGGFTFTPAATPEPSAYALGICAALLFLVLRRRHTVA